MFTITKEFSFAASHQLSGLPETHPCARLHGHNYVVIVELQAKYTDETGFVFDYRNLDAVKTFIDEAFDHRHLNDCLDFNPTAENIARALFNEFSAFVPYLKSVSVKETDKTCARYEPIRK